MAEVARAFQAQGMHAEMRDIGPEASGMAGRVAGEGLLNRVMRARDAAVMFAGFDRQDPRRSTGLMRSLVRPARYMMMALRHYHRSIRIEQEVLYAHAMCWEIAAQSGAPVIVFESDAIVPPEAVSNLVQVVRFVLNDREIRERGVYVDLAGGCNPRDILNSWCFEERFGRRTLIVPGLIDLEVYRLPKLTTNTVGGYLVDAKLAQEFCRQLKAKHPMVAPDWAINVFALRSRLADEAVCIHTQPTILSQGSLDGTYASTIDARSRGGPA